jgi:hypothetical protein
MLVSFQIGGRTGNNIIQYMICKVLGMHFGHIYVPKENFPSGDPKTDSSVLFITDENIQEILKNPPKDIRQKHLFCETFFQRSDYYLPKRKELQDLFYDPNNPDYWNTNHQRIYARDILQNTRHRIPLEDDDLIMHVRLDDFFSGKPEPNPCYRLPFLHQYPRKNKIQETLYCD